MNILYAIYLLVIICCYVCLVFRPPKRYGLKLKRQIPVAAAPLLLLALFGVLLSANVCTAGDGPSLWGSSMWFDWSDYRATVGLRVFLARLTSGSLEENGTDVDLLTAHGMTNDPEPFREILVELYVDRLGLRFSVEEDNTFKGRVGGAPGDIIPRSSELETSTGRLGVDVDLIRYPFLRLGIDYDLYLGNIKLLDRKSSDPTRWTAFSVQGREPMTIGVHGMAIPFRVRGVPVTVQARARFPIPLVQKDQDAKITDWEISGGLRPAIWETSLYGHSTFAVALNGGFRSVNLETDLLSGDSRSAQLKARWQGAYIELGLAF